MEIMGVSSTSFDTRHESVPVLSSMSTPKPHKSLKASSSLPSFLSDSNMFVNVAGPSRHIISSPLRTYTPATVRAPPIDTSSPSPTRASPQPLERVPTEPASAPPRPEQPTTAELAVLGIKVRDFAFEPNSLPPVPSVKRPFFRELGSQHQESPEDLEARRRNEARRLEFNAPRRRLETPDEREALRLAFHSPRVTDAPNAGLQSSSRIGGGSRNNFDPSIFSKWTSILNTRPGPSSSQGSSPRQRLPLQRQPSEIYLPRPSAGMHATNPCTSVFSNRHAQQGPTLFSPNAGNTNIVQAHEPIASLQLPGLDKDWLARSPNGSWSQPLAFASQPDPTLRDSQDSQTDSEMDDEDYVKTPLVTPNGSLVFDNDEDNLFNVTTGTELDGDSTNVSTYVGSRASTNTAETNDSIIDSSALPESQMAELLPAVNMNEPDDNVTASQIGLESQDLLSQPAWQQLSQSQAQPWSQQLDSQAEGDVEMPEDVENRNAECDRTPTLTPTSSLDRVSSTLVSPVRTAASANSYHSAASSQPRPIARVSPRSSPSRRSPSFRSLTPTHSQSSLRRTPSFHQGGGLSRRPSLSGKLKPGPPVIPGSHSGLGKARYNLRSPTPKKAKLVGASSPSTSRPRTRSRTRSVPASKRSAASTVDAAAARRTRSAAAQARSRAKGTRNGGEDGDVDMAEEANDNQVLS